MEKSAESVTKKKIVPYNPAKKKKKNPLKYLNIENDTKGVIVDQSCFQKRFFLIISLLCAIQAIKCSFVNLFLNLDTSFINVPFS